MALNFPKEYSDKKYMNPPELHGSLPVMRAKVVKNNDPKKIGRIQVRIPSYHGVPGFTDKFVEDEDLPWAMPCFYGGSGQDMGSFLVPIPGSYVWLLFEDNDLDKPVYFGGVPSVGSKLSKVMNNINDPESPQQPWNTQPGMSDAPWDEFDGKTTGVPERQIIYKSQKGHTIMCDDTDEEESMTFIDRLGQVIKFFCGVSKGKNAERYHRELYSAEKDQQLGEGLTEDPSIMMRSGETQDGAKIHSMIRMYATKMRGECIDADQDKHTSTDYSPYEFNQETQESILNMTEEHIYEMYKDLIKESFCDDYWSLRAFEKCFIECTKGHMLFQFDGNGLYIDDNSLKLTFKGTTLIETDKDFKVVTSDLFSIKSNDTEIKGDSSGLNGKGKEVKFEGSGSVYTSGGKTYMTGTEIHFNKG